MKPTKKQQQRRLTDMLASRIAWLDAKIEQLDAALLNGEIGIPGRKNRSLYKAARREAAELLAELRE